MLEIPEDRDREETLIVKSEPAISQEAPPMPPTPKQGELTAPLEEPKVGGDTGSSSKVVVKTTRSTRVSVKTTPPDF